MGQECDDVPEPTPDPTIAAWIWRYLDARSSFLPASVGSETFHKFDTEKTFRK